MIDEDRILQAMPNIVMALHVLCERMNPQSFWKPYLGILFMKSMLIHVPDYDDE